jgi:hypothetical protein
MDECVTLARVSLDLTHLAGVMAQGYAVGLAAVLVHLPVATVFQAIKRVMGVA